MSEAVVACTDLAKSYAARGGAGGGHRVQAVFGVSLALTSGEVVAVVGRSGSGKSTLARLLVGLETPDAGEVRIGGEDLVSAGERRRARLRQQVQLVVQEPRSALDPLQPVGSAVAEPMAIHRLCPRSERAARVDELFRMVGLPAGGVLRGRLPHELSGGECQRVLLARAMACQPRLLILDEPVTALDAVLRRQVVAELMALQRRVGIGLLLFAHDLRLVQEVAQRILVMERGEVVEQGETGSVIAHPQAATTRVLLAAAGVQ
jgi:ABC-type glutathione transport system ATPase component